ncbi:hypothetical protein MBLNU459_g7571t1 [Dothideomycetes sp. NU459]
MSSTSCVAKGFSSTTTSPLAAIPSELLIRVFAAVDAWRDLQSLRQACRATNALWHAHGLVIVNRHLSDHAYCIDDAVQLSAAQSRQCVRNPGQNGDAGYFPTEPTWQQKARKAYALDKQCRHLYALFRPHLTHSAPYCVNKTCKARPYARPSRLEPHHYARLAHAQYFLRRHAESRRPTAPLWLAAERHAALHATPADELLLLVRVLQLLTSHARAPERALLGTADPTATDTLVEPWRRTYLDVLDACYAAIPSDGLVEGAPRAVMRKTCLWHPVLRPRGCYAGEEGWDRRRGGMLIAPDEPVRVAGWVRVPELLHDGSTWGLLRARKRAVVRAVRKLPGAGEDGSKGERGDESGAGQGVRFDEKDDNERSDEEANDEETRDANLDEGEWLM